MSVMSGRMINRFTKYASYLEPEQVRQIVEIAKDSKRVEPMCLLLWMGLRSGAQLRDLMMLRTEEAWDGYVPVWDDYGEQPVFVDVCKDRRELEWVRQQIDRYRPGRMVFGWIPAKSVDRWVKRICKQANIENIDGYAAVVRPYGEIKNEIRMERARSILV